MFEKYKQVKKIKGFIKEREESIQHCNRRIEEFTLAGNESSIKSWRSLMKDIRNEHLNLLKELVKAKRL